jgi:hypothetical protein
MTHSSLRIRTVCLGVIAAVALATAVPAQAQESTPEFVDPTIVTDDRPVDDQPEGVKNLGPEQTATKKWEYNTPPVYTKWWFWAAAVVATGVVTFLAIVPLTRQARGCTTSGTGKIPLNCIGDGRSP